MDRDGLFDAEGLLASMRGVGLDVSKATVYRTLRLLQDAGILTPFMILGANVTHYQLAYGRDPVDYLVCMETGTLTRIEGDDVMALRDRIAARHGWDVVGHRFVIYGTSPEAIKDDKRAASPQESSASRPSSA